MFNFQNSLAPQVISQDADGELSLAVLRLAVVTWPEHAAGIVADWMTSSCDDALADKSLASGNGNAA